MIHRLVFIVLLSGLFATPVASQVTKVRAMERDMLLVRENHLLLLSLDCSEVFSDWVRKRLSSGFTSRVLVEIQLKDKGSKKILARGFLQYRILYDLWEEVFVVRVEGVGQQDVLRFHSMDALVRRIGALRKQALVVSTPLVGGLYRAEVRVVVNPTSPELLRKIRTYLRNPDGRRSIGGSKSFFGTLSPIFVEEERFHADLILVYRSGPLKLDSKEGQVEP
jgi:hypothetical protein